MMSRTYVKGRTTRHKNKGYKRTDHKHGHCWYCGYDPRKKGQLKTEQYKSFRFDILPFMDDILKKE